MKSVVKKPTKQKSLFSEQLENCPELPHRQYLDYAKFDGTAQLGLPTKSFKIFMTMLPEKHQNYPLVVCVIASAKIKDLIGFTCYKYRYDSGVGSRYDTADSILLKKMLLSWETYNRRPYQINV